LTRALEGTGGTRSLGSEHADAEQLLPVLEQLVARR
jgi:hypothetical protein